MFFGFLSAHLNKKKRFSRLLFASVLFWAVPVWGGEVISVNNTEQTPFQPAALNYTGTYQLREANPELTGKGVTIASVCRSLTYIEGQPQDDYQLNMQHKCFSGRDVNFADGLDSDIGLSEHSTAIGAILVGRDPTAYHPEAGRFNDEGAAPKETVIAYEFWRFVNSNVFGGDEFEADILTMSVGEVFEDWWTRGIERLAEKKGLIVVAGIGNGDDVFDPVLYPAAGGNVIGVGVIDSVRCEELSRRLGEFWLPRPEHSSYGPTGDGRSKPDIVAPGNCLVPDANSVTGYDISGAWSSFSTPVVAGTVGLLVQKAMSDPNLNLAVSREGGNCVMKAILMNSATKLPYWHKGAIAKEDDHEVSLDYIQGAGALNALAAYEHLAAGRGQMGTVQETGWDNNVIEKNADVENVYSIEIPEPEDKFITATLVWNRHFEDVYPFAHLYEADSDLRLELWAVDPNTFAKDYLVDYSDSVSDNVEHIYRPVDANYTSYEIVVTSGVADPNEVNGVERYALAWKVSTADEQRATMILECDLNGDGEVNTFDFEIVANNLGTRPAETIGYLSGDVNTDGLVDIKDARILIRSLSSKK